MLSNPTVFRRSALAAAGCSALVALASLSSLAPLTASASDVGLSTTVTTGQFAYGLALDTHTHSVFTTNPATSTVSVFDGSQASPAVSLVHVGAEPLAVAVDSTSHLVFVGNSGDGTLSWFDGGSASPAVTTVPVGGEPSAVAVDESTGTGFVSSAADNTVSWFSESAPDHLLGTVAVGQRPSALAVDPATHEVFVVNQDDDTVSRFLSPMAPGASGGAPSVTVVAVGDHPTGIALDTDTGVAFVSNMDSNSVSRFPTAGAAPLVQDVPVGSSPSGVAVNPETHQVFVSDFRGAQLSQFDGTSSTPMALDIPNIKTPWGVAVDPSTGSIFVANRLNSFVSRLRPTAPEAAHLTMTTPPAATTDVNYFFGFSVSGNPRPKLALLGDLPDGMTFDAANGLLIGLPTAVSSSALTLRATNGVGVAAELRFTFVVNPPAPELVASGELSSAKVGAGYHYNLAAPGSAPSTCTVSGRAPVGLTGCALAGTPKAAGDYTFSVTSRNAGGSVTREYEIIVLPAGVGGPCAKPSC